MATGPLYVGRIETIAQPCPAKADVVMPVLKVGLRYSRQNGHLMAFAPSDTKLTGVDTELKSEVAGGND